MDEQNKDLDLILIIELIKIKLSKKPNIIHKDCHLNHKKKINQATFKTYKPRMQYCVRQLFCTSAVKNPATQIHSLRRDSLFYVKKMQTVPGSMLLGIYRRYLKESLRVYKRLDGAIGEYLFGFLELRKTDIRRRLKTKRDT